MQPVTIRNTTIVSLNASLELPIYKECVCFLAKTGESTYNFNLNVEVVETQCLSPSLTNQRRTDKKEKPSLANEVQAGAVGMKSVESNCTTIITPLYVPGLEEETNVKRASSVF